MLGEAVSANPELSRVHIELIAADENNDAYQRVVASGVRDRFVVDAASFA